MAVEFNSDAANFIYNSDLTTQTTASASKSMTMNDFWKLLAAQLQYQDMSNPMSNSEMMEQITQMSTMNTMSSLSSAIANFGTVTNNLSSVTLTTYSTGLLGKEVTIAITDDDGKIKDKVKGTVTGVDLTGATSVYVNGAKYELSQVMAIGDVPETKDDSATGSNGSTSESTSKA